ncbi:acyl transferase/acyl hydrolase/lysophospholipase [Xylariales sp. PMI_506]|nr:acyl transferase/acyl hydrolase/lysophospholipase [Xylariales sp. PMI_506]
MSLLRNFAAELESPSSSVDLRALASALQSHRPHSRCRISFSAGTTQELIDKIHRKLEASQPDPELPIENTIASGCEEPRILYVFSGQGAGSTSMGAELIRNSTYARDRVRHLDYSLSTLPECRDRPTWSIEALITAKPAAAARTAQLLGQVRVSQSIITAIQIVLVDLLRVAGVRASDVVGHSSGEVAAAYAAGFLSAHDAIRVGYYMALHVERAAVAGKEAGGMLAVGLSFRHGQAFCAHPLFKDRLWAAAHNSGASSTLSGDASAIEKAGALLRAKKVFCRVLDVKGAFHCSRMVATSDTFLEDMRGLGVEVLTSPKDAPAWHSTVVPGTVMNAAQPLQGSYWLDNVINPVLFGPAVRAAVARGAHSVIEIGLRPVLKTPSQ